MKRLLIALLTVGALAFWASDASARWFRNGSVSYWPAPVYTASSYATPYYSGSHYMPYYAGSYYAPSVNYFPGTSYYYTPGITYSGVPRTSLYYTPGVSYSSYSYPAASYYSTPYVTPAYYYTPSGTSYYAPLGNVIRYAY